MNQVPATLMDWGKNVHPKLQKSEFPEGVLDKMDYTVILALSELRSQVGLPLVPSPIYGAHVRHKPGKGRHNLMNENGKPRLSDAVDFFCSWEAAWKYLEAARRNPDIGGIGIYVNAMFGGKEIGEMAMMHIDMRPSRLEWVGWRQDESQPYQYTYLSADPVRYHKILGELARNG